MGRGFWIFCNLAILALYAAAAYYIVIDQHALHLTVVISVLFLIFHILELPIAALVLKGMNPSWLKVFFGTLIFGFTWWLPAKKGIYST